MMDIVEDMSLAQATQILILVSREYDVHLEHCLLCIPGKWLCPDAHLFQDNIKHWDRRVVSLLPPEEEVVS